MFFRELCSKSITLSLIVAMGITHVSVVRAEEWQDEMYKSLRKDIKTQREQLKPYLTDLYKNMLNYHNILRMQDFFAAYAYAVSETQKVSSQMLAVFSGIAKIDLGNQSVALMAQSGPMLKVYDNELASIANRVEHLTKHTKGVLKAWQNRTADSVISNLEKSYDFKSKFPTPELEVNHDFDSYVFQVEASYIPGQGSMHVKDFRLEGKPKMTDVVFQSAKHVITASQVASAAATKTAESALVALGVGKLVFDVGASVYKKDQHEKKITALAKEHAEVIESVRSGISADQRKMILASITDVMVDKDAKFENQLKALIGELDGIHSYLKTKRANLNQDFNGIFIKFFANLDRVATVNVDQIVSGAQKSNRLLEDSIRQFHDESKKVVASMRNFEADLNTTQGRPEQKFGSKYRLIVRLIQADSYLHTKFLKDQILAGDQDYFFNQPQALSQEYPNGDWLSYVISLVRSL